MKVLGVPEELIALVRSIVSEDDFKAAQPKLPCDAYEALDLVREGYDIQEVVDTLYGESIKQANTDIATALTNPITQMQFT